MAAKGVINTNIEQLARSKKVYEANLDRLHQMARLMNDIGNPSQIAADKIQQAIRQCGLCIKRMESLMSSLKDGDTRHIESQISSLMTEIDGFEKLTIQVNNEIQQIKTAYIQKYQKSA